MTTTTEQARQEPSTAIVKSGQRLKEIVEDKLDSIRSIIPRHVTAERIAKAVLLAASRQPKLLQCTANSIVKALMDASEVGLEPSGGALGHAYLVPYRNKKTGTLEAQFIPGYRGLIDLAKRAGGVADVWPELVMQGDEFRWHLGTSPELVHVPDLEVPRDWAHVTHGYVVARYPNGMSTFRVMTKTQIEKIRARSKAKDTGPWVTDTEEMACKTLVRRICKYLPMSVHLAAALTKLDDTIGPDFDAEIISAETVDRLDGETKGDAVKRRIRGKPAAGDEGGPAGRTEDPDHHPAPTPPPQQPAPGPAQASEQDGDDELRRVQAKKRFWAAVEAYARYREGWRKGALSEARIDICWERVEAETPLRRATIDQASAGQLNHWAIHYENLLAETQEAQASAPEPDEPPPPLDANRAATPDPPDDWMDSGPPPEDTGELFPDGE